MRARYLRRLLAGVVVLAGCVVATGGGTSLGAGPPADTWSSLPTLSQLEGELSVSYDQSTVPPKPDPRIGAFDFGVGKGELYGQTGCGQVGGDTTDIRSETPCTFGDRTATRSVLVVGDSQAGMWIPTFDTWGIQEHWKVYRLMKLACTPWTDPTTWPNCVAWRKFVIREILRLRPTVVVAAAMEDTKQDDAVSLAPRKIESYILGFVRAISRAHAKVFIAQSIPWFFLQGSPETCLASYRTDVSKCNHDSPSAVLASSMEQGVSLAAATGKVSDLEVDQLFCTEQACPVLVGSYNLYIDEFHFQEPWGRYIARAFSQVFSP
jgi:hypothetical protein